jgi:hypothetical protein
VSVRESDRLLEPHHEGLDDVCSNYHNINLNERIRNYLTVLDRSTHRAPQPRHSSDIDQSIILLVFVTPGLETKLTGLNDIIGLPFRNRSSAT